MLPLSKQLFLMSTDDADVTIVSATALLLSLRSWIPHVYHQATQALCNFKSCLKMIVQTSVLT